MIPIVICLFLVPIFYNPFFVNSFTQGKELLFKFVILVTLIVVPVYWLLQRSFKIKPLLKSVIFIFLAIGAFFVLISTILSPTPIITLYGTYGRGFGLFTEFFLFCYVIYCAFVLDEKAVTILLRYAFIGGVIVGSYGLLQKIGFDFLFHNYNKDVFVGRIFSFMGNPGYLGQLMLLDFIVGVFFIFNSPKRLEKLLYVVGSSIVFIALWFSQTRTSLLALLVCSLLVVFKYGKGIYEFFKKIKFKYKLISSICVVLLGILLIFLPKDRFSFDDESLRSLNSRSEIWKGAISLIQKRPWFGYGQETFSIYSPEIINKEFLTLEEDVHLSIDRIHNELLETVFSYGIFTGIVYLSFVIYLFWKYFKQKEKVPILLALLVIANILQNQFAFSDISISLFMGFCLAGLVASEIKNKREISISLNKITVYFLVFFISITGFGLYYETICKPFLSQLAYAESQNNYSKSYDIAVAEHKKAIFYAPNYSELWYELMSLDPSSMPRALENIKRIEGDSGDLLAWEGNYYADSDPEKASQKYLQALEKNPYYPDWIRSYADMLYKNGDNEDALYLYKQYLEAVPDFWKWKDTLDQHTLKERTSYRIFFKNVPDFWKTVDRVEALESLTVGESL